MAVVSRFQAESNVAGSTINLWYARPNEKADAETIETMSAMLSAEEQGRWKSFRFPSRQYEYLTAHALARTALSHQHPLSAKSWRFEKNQYGKPHLKPPCGLHFNLAHAPSLVVCLVGQAVEVGVDVEPFERAETISEVASTVFSAIEISQLECLNGDARLDRALSLWTMKEAYIKARGFGLSLPLKKFSVIYSEGEPVRLQLDPSLGKNPGHWFFTWLDIAGHRIAMMVESGASPDVQIGEWQAAATPAFAAVTHPKVTWYSTSLDRS